MTKIIGSLWSGGLDSTIATYHFARLHPEWTIQPIHILIRMGSGKDARERKAIDEIYEQLKDQFPNVSHPIRVKHRIRPSDNRNLEMVHYVKENYGLDEIILGTHTTIHTNPLDSDWEALEKESGVTIYDLRKLGHATKAEQFKIGVDLLGVDVLKKTWSCQLWFKKPCGRCFSCKDRIKLFEELN